MAFHTLLKRLREEAGLTQAELSERSGLSQTGISDLEQGLNQPTLKTAQALAKALGVNCTAFDDADDEPEEEEPRRGRGRPPKPKTEDQAEADKPKRGRGRPRKQE
jgi:transcriptional regulator with XRE-family HTH domain